MAQTYDVINLGNDGNETDGYSIGSAHFTGNQVTLDHPTRSEALQALKDLGALTDLATDNSVSRYEDEIGAFDSTSITLKDKESGLFLFELRPAH